MSYAEQLNEITRIKISDEETKRIDCLFCGGNKTMTLTKRDGNLIWNCYKASCNAKGVARVNRSAATIKSALSKRLSRNSTRIGRSFPELVVTARNRDKVEIYLRENHCFDALDNGLVNIKYAPKEDRVLFYTQDGLGAVGRSLAGQKPKWMAYGDTSNGFQCGNGGTAVIVEDAASACAVASSSSEFTGFALLGTQLTKKHVNKLLHFPTLIVALDQDASIKGLRFKRELMGVHKNVRLNVLKEDLKYLSLRAIKEKLNES